MHKEFLINEQIKFERIRIVNEKGENLGVFLLDEGLKLAKEKGLDLILITEKTSPPVCKIANFGKFLYQLRKKEKEKKKKIKKTEMKTIQLSFKIAYHDLETKANQAQNFLGEGFKVRVEMRLKGREKKFFDMAKEKLDKFLEILKNQIEFKIEEELKKESWGFYITLAQK